MNGEEEEVTDPALAASIRRRALKVLGQSVVAAGAITALVMAL